MSKNKSWNTETTIYVGNLDAQVTTELLYELFIQVAPIASIKYPKDKVLQTYQGYAFVEFFTEEDAKYAMKLMNNTVNLYGKTLKVGLSNYSLSSSIGNISSNKNENTAVDILPIPKLFIKDIDATTSSEYLNSLFKKIGPVVNQPEFFYLSNGQVKCAYLYMKSYEDSDKALELLNNELIGNKRITIDYAFKDGSSKKIKYGEDIDRLLNKEALKRNLLK